MVKLNNIVFYLKPNRFRGVSVKNNTFGNNVYSNTFGNDVYSNTFGNNVYSNTFGNSVGYNTFGNGAYAHLYKNHFGDGVRGLKHDGFQNDFFVSIFNIQNGVQGGCVQISETGCTSREELDLDVILSSFNIFPKQVYIEKTKDIGKYLATSKISNTEKEVIEIEVPIL